MLGLNECRGQGPPDHPPGVALHENLRLEPVDALHGLQGDDLALELHSAVKDVRGDLRAALAFGGTLGGTAVVVRLTLAEGVEEVPLGLAEAALVVEAADDVGDRLLLVRLADPPAAVEGGARLRIAGRARNVLVAGVEDRGSGGATLFEPLPADLDPASPTAGGGSLVAIDRELGEGVAVRDLLCTVDTDADQVAAGSVQEDREVEEGRAAHVAVAPVRVGAELRTCTVLVVGDLLVRLVDADLGEGAVADLIRAAADELVVVVVEGGGSVDVGSLGHGRGLQ